MWPLLKKMYFCDRNEKENLIMANFHHVVIIGAEPAGTVCGYLLQKHGVDCVIVDHATFPREKICGGGLTPKAYGLLQELMPDLRYEYQSVRRFKFMLEGKTISEVDLDNELRMVVRKDFDNELLQQYLSIGGKLVKGSFSRFEEQPDGKILVSLKSGEPLLCDFLVGADGANSQVRRQITGSRSYNTLWMEQYVERGRTNSSSSCQNSIKRAISSVSRAWEKTLWEWAATTLHPRKSVPN